MNSFTPRLTIIGRSLPPNARANTYAGDWTCDHGFRRVDDVCVKVSIPVNATCVVLQKGN
jgi:hypothetical protein